MFHTHHQPGQGGRARRFGIVAGLPDRGRCPVRHHDRIRRRRRGHHRPDHLRARAPTTENVAVADNNVHTIVISSPVLADGTYEVNSVIGFNNLTAGSVVLCGWTTSDNGDALYGNYGEAENEAATAVNGSCTVTGVAEINGANDELKLWATVYSGPARPVANSWSMNETPVGSAVVSSLT